MDVCEDCHGTGVCPHCEGNDPDCWFCAGTGDCQECDGNGTEPVAFIDTESLGLDPEAHPVWEVAVIVDGSEHTWFQRVSTEAIRAAEPIALEITGFHDRYDPAVALGRDESIQRFNRLVSGRHLVGLCPWFDSERLHAQHRRMVLTDEYKQRRHPWHYHLIDMETMIVGYLLGCGGTLPPLPWKSADLVRAIGVDPDLYGPAHQALADARLARACWKALTA